MLNEVFKVNETIPYDLRIQSKLYARDPTKLRYGTETISFLSPKIWSLIPQNVKDSDTVPCFKKKKKREKKNKLPMSFKQNIFVTCWF